MPQPTGTFSKYDAVGIRESLSDAIYNISPSKTPFMSMAGRGSAGGNTKFEWQTDALAAASTTNYVIEGDDIGTFDAVTPTVRLDNQTQISRKTVVVTGTLEATTRAGRKSELAYQMAKKMQELKTDMESMCLANNAKVVGNDTTARETGSLLAYLGTNTFHQSGSSGADPSPLDGSDPRTDDGTPVAFTEAMLKDVAAQIFTSGGTLKVLMLGTFNKQAASAFTGIAAQRHNAQGAKPSTIVGAADIYVSDFGNLSIVPNIFQRGRDALFIDPEYVEIAYLRPFFKKDIAVTGDNIKKALYVEWGLKVKQEKALGGVFDLTTS